MKGRYRKPCKGCGEIAYPPDRTKSGNHFACAATIAEKVMDQMRAKSGPYWDRYVNAQRIVRPDFLNKMTTVSLQSRRPDGI